jgi:spore coat polysaccharide biosynthesis protein SpsF (cytidylyltransferase family)
MKKVFRPGVVICSRLDSERVPGKVLKPINGAPIICHLVNQLTKLNIPVVVAVPANQSGAYEKALSPMASVSVWPSKFFTDPLARTCEAAKAYGFTHVVRVTHDKIFVDLEGLRRALLIAEHETEGVEYIHSTTLTPGTGFEIITADCLARASLAHKNVEHITYAVRPVSKLSIDLVTETEPFNLLIDFAEDLKLFEVLFASLGNQATLSEVTRYLKRNPDLIRINLPPLLTVYTCVHNGERFIGRALNSIIHQGNFKKEMELIIVDDFSTDKTLEIVAKFALGKPNVSWFRNSVNKGLASSSNVALSKARGRYILRLDADDFFVDDTALSNLIQHAKESKAEVVYPDNYFGGLDKIQKGSEKHHVGGALFDKKALSFLRFKDGLRNHDSLDIFTRAKNKLKVGYYEKPVFFYTQRSDSMSKTNLKEREETAKAITAGAL